MKLLTINRSAAMLTAASLADRGFIGVATLLATVLIGRWAGAEELGLFSLFFPAVILAIALEESLITAPYTYFAARHAAPDERRDYLGSVLRHTMILSAVTSLLLLLAAGVAYAAGWRGYVAAIAILAPVVPCVLLREFSRRVVYADLRPMTAAWISGGVSVVQLALMAAIHWSGQLTAVTAFAAMGISSVIGGALWLWANREEIECRPTGVKSAFARNWFLARWTTATQIGEVVRIQMFPWLLAVVLNEHTVGIYAACAAIATLSGPLQIAVSNILLPQFAAAEEQKRLADADRLMWQATAWMTLVMTLFTLVVGSVSGSIVPRLYGSEFVGTQWPLVLLLVAQLISAASMPAARALVALQRPDLDFVCQLAGIVLNLAAGVPLVLEWGITGAAWSGVLAAMTKAALTAVFYTREIHARSRRHADAITASSFAETMQPAMIPSWREQP
jgi:O-antigen/teichoic acid export membrane protein